VHTTTCLWTASVGLRRFSYRIGRRVLRGRWEELIPIRGRRLIDRVDWRFSLVIVEVHVFVEVMVVKWGNLFMTSFMARTVGAQSLGFGRAASGPEEMRRFIAIVTTQQSSCSVWCWVGHHVFARVVERRQVPGVHLGVVCARRLSTDAVQQFGLWFLLPVAPTAVDPQRFLSAGA